MTANALPSPLPLFPLQTVLFPGAVLGLRVFEARYLDLMADCLRTRQPFGVVCLKAGVEAGEVLREFRVAPDQLAGFKPGDVVAASIFSVGQKVDISGTSIGKGYAGAITRHNFSSNRASHGNSVSHNSPGSIGMAQDPGRVFPGKRMAGHLGAVKTTVQNLEVVRVDVERGLLLIKGAVPGHDGGDVIVRPAVKAN